MAWRRKSIFGIVCLSLLLFAVAAALLEIYMQGGRVIAALLWLKCFCANAGQAIKNFFTSIEEELHNKRVTNLK